MQFSRVDPPLYDRYLGPIIFEPYAQDLANSVVDLNAERVLETAAGTGIVTRALVGSRSLRTSLLLLPI
jgi:phospholipid N-methyltransferase